MDIEINHHGLEKEHWVKLPNPISDSSIVNLGAPNASPVPTTKMDDPWNAEPDLAGHGVSSLLHANTWGTNYVMWYPFYKDGAAVADEQTIVARYNLRL